ncbi:MAG TPA: hypothetical protein VFL12_07010 [Thermoanaerobaculia bacterium]|nr:hypothetical protein [Thermoanaerobaculia bacterium]
MTKLQKLEPAAFVLLFAATYYAVFVLPPRSALYDLSSVEALAGWATVAVAIALLVLRLLPGRRLRLERSIYAAFLAAMPLIYLAASFQRQAGPAIGIELAGTAIFVGLAFFGYFRSFVVLGWGIAAHGVGWDLWHHGSSYISPWYPFACMVIDLALGFLVITQASEHSGRGREAD